MSREILFKAKRLDNGEWVEGYYVCSFQKHYIFQYNECGFISHIVDPDTICQYTGLTDKSGKRIWENDILELPDEDGYFTCEWEEDAARFVMTGDGLTVDFDNYWCYQTEEAGNIFDNADLLEVE